MEYNQEKVDGLDDRIAERAKNGDKDSQEYLLTKYKNLVKKIAQAYKIAGADTEDIIQEGMIGLYKAIRDFDSTKGVYFHVFAKTCINRQIITAVRTANRKKLTPLNEYISLDSTFEAEEENHRIEGEDFESKNPEALFLAKEQREIFQKMLADLLTQKEMQVLRLYTEGYTYKEMAEEVGITEKGISSTIHRIKRKLLTRGTNII